MLPLGDRVGLGAFSCLVLCHPPHPSHREIQAYGMGMTCLLFPGSPSTLDKSNHSLWVSLNVATAQTTTPGHQTLGTSEVTVPHVCSKGEVAEQGTDRSSG